MSKGSIELSNVLKEAMAGNEKAIANLFSGFLSNAETVDGCGYLGSLGFIFPEQSFWCVTDLRACSLRIKRGGELVFSSGYISHINSDAFYQPSLTLLWVLIAVLVIGTLGVGILLVPWIVKAFYQAKKSGIVFWVREGIPVYIFADRNNLRKAQQVFALISDTIKKTNNSRCAS